MTDYNVRTYGAVGDGAHKDTNAIQKTIDTCAAEGGGRVYIPSGTYLTGTIFLRDNITLHFESGCTLLASTDKEDYYFSKVYQEEPEDLEIDWGVGLIYGKNLTNISICGDGIIDGQDTAFWILRNDLTEKQRATRVHYRGKEWRPQMLLLDGCSNATVREITIQHSPIYAGWFVECSNLIFQGIRILNHFHGINTDGLHFGSCQIVHISDSYFHTGDDSIAIDGIGKKPSEFFTITNCIFESIDNVFRIYTGLSKKLAGKPGGGSVRDIVISNCTVRNASGVINIAADRGIIERIQISNLTIRQELPGVPFMILADQGTVRHVQISNILVQSNGALTVTCKPGDIVEDIRLNDVHFVIIPQEKEFGLGLPDAIRSMTVYHQSPYFIYLRGAQSVSLRDISIAWEKSDMKENWSALQAINVNQLSIDGFSGKSHGKPEENAVIHLENVGQARISQCAAEEGTHLYLQVSGEHTQRVMLSHNDFAKTTKIWEGNTPEETTRLQSCVVIEN